MANKLDTASPIAQNLVALDNRPATVKAVPSLYSPSEQISAVNAFAVYEGIKGQPTRFDPNDYPWVISMMTNLFANAPGAGTINLTLFVSPAASPLIGAVL